MAKVLVTGGSRGIGAVCAATLRTAGHDVTAVGSKDFDVASPWPVAPGEYDAVVCAAGVIGTPGRPAQVDDFARTLSVNVLGVWHAAQVLDHATGTLVAFAGGGATSPLVNFDSYATSKAAVVRLVENLAAGGLRANAVSPGFIVTGMQDDVLRHGPERVGSEYFAKVSDAVASGGGEDPQLAADLVAWLLSDASAGVSGKVIAAKWDPWGDAAFAQRLRDEDDLATLRRIDDQFFERKAT